MWDEWWTYDGISGKKPCFSHSFVLYSVIFPARCNPAMYTADDTPSRCLTSAVSVIPIIHYSAILFDAGKNAVNLPAFVEKITIFYRFWPLDITFSD
jgi:hypothetical protein